MFNPLFVHGSRFSKHYFSLYDPGHTLYNLVSRDNKNYLQLPLQIKDCIDFCPRNGPFHDAWRRDLSKFDQFVMPDHNGQSLDFSEICDLVATDIVNKVNNSDRTLLVSYSGGVDSTLVLISLLKNGINKDKLLILLSESSISENPIFYQNFIYNKLNCEDILAFFAREKDYRSFYRVTGEFGNQIGCSYTNYVFHDRHRISTKTSYQNWKIQLVSSYLPTASSELLEWLVAQLDNNIAQAPCNIETTSDYLWWMNFNFKWLRIYYGRCVSFDVYGLVTKRDSQAATKHLSGELEFFARREFQIWSMQHTGQSPEKFPDDNKIYAPSSKKYILDYNGDTDYYRNKGKFRSVTQIENTNIDSPLFIDSQGISYWPPLDREIGKTIVNLLIDK